MFYFIVSSLFLIPAGYGMTTHSTSAFESDLIKAAQNGDSLGVQVLALVVSIIAKIDPAKIDPELIQAILNGDSACLLAFMATINLNLENFHTPLHGVAYSGHKEVVMLLLQKGADINAKNPHGDTPLHHAVSEGHKEVVKLLLQKGADVTAKNCNGYTPLHFAAHSGYTDIVEMFIEQGADITVKNDIHFNNTALHYAARDGHKKTVELLLAKGADVNALNEYGSNPLRGAALFHYEEAVEVLIAFGAEIPQNLVANSIVMQAQENQLQLRIAPDFKAKVQLLNKGVYACPAMKELINTKKEHLLTTIKQDNVEAVKVLLKEGFSINTCGKNGNNLLHVAIAHKSHNVLALLVYFCSQDNKNVWDKKNSAGLTPMQVALSVSNFEAFKIMLNISQENVTIDATQTTGSKRSRQASIDLKST